MLHAEVQFLPKLQLGDLCPFQPWVSVSSLFGAVVQT